MDYPEIPSHEALPSEEETAHRPVLTIFVGTRLLVTARTAAEEKAAEASSAKSYSPYAGRAYPTHVLWWDTNLHTALSVDASAFGNRLGLDEAYRFAGSEAG